MGQQELITQPTEAMPGSKPWSPGLGSLLLRDDGAGSSDGGAIRLIAINPKLRAEAQALAPRLEAAKQPATREEIIMVVMREMPAWGVGHKAAAEFGVTYASYADALEGLPLYAIEEGVVRWNRAEGHKDLSMGGFPPRPAQLYALATEGKRELYLAAWRAKKALEWVEKQGVEWTPERKRAEREKAIAMGFLNPDGSSVPLAPARRFSDAPRPRMTPQQVAAQLRAAAERGGDDVGEVI